MILFFSSQITESFDDDLCRELFFLFVFLKPSLDALVEGNCYSSKFDVSVYP